MIVPNFIGPSYTSLSPNADAEQCMNWYVEVMESAGAKVPTALCPCPGFTVWSDGFGGSCRGLYEVELCVPYSNVIETRVYGMFGNQLYRFASDGTPTLCTGFTIVDDGLPCDFATNGSEGNQLLFTSAGDVFCLDFTTDTFALALVALSANGIAVTHVDFLDGFFLALAPAQNAFYVSALEDGLTWDYTQKAVRSASADPWIMMKVIHKEIWLQGGLTTDVWYNAGASPFPFAPIPGAFLEVGTPAAWATNNVDSTLVWLGSNQNGQGVIWRSNGYVPVRISTHAVETALAGYGELSGAVSFTYQDRGHSFYVLTVPGQGTWVYDTRTGLWHERGLWNSGSNQFDAYRPLYHASAFNQHLVGDRASGTIFTMAITVATEVDGNGIRRVRRSPHQWDGIAFNTVFFRGLQIDMQTGLGLSGGAVPQVTLNWSDDGGQTYPTDIQQPASAGAMGELQTRVIFLQLGSSRDRVWQLVVNDAVVPWAILQAAYRPDPVIGRS